MKVLILAGGRGTRLWPLSRRCKPKQFQKLLGEKTMLQETVDRVLPLFSAKDIYIATNKEYFREVRSELPQIPQENIISEPANRERVAAFLLFFVYLSKNDFSQPVLILPSDHLIKDVNYFQEVIICGGKFVEQNPDKLLLLGEKPIFPDTGLGYIKKGKSISKIGKFTIYEVPSFKEKPNLSKARSFVKSKKYLWNAGIFIFTPSLIEKLAKKFVPDNYYRYKKIKESFGKKFFDKILEREYLEMDKVSFDTSIVENYNQNVVIKTSMGWSDVGTWTVLKNCLSSPNDNYIKGNYTGIDSKNIMVYGVSDKLVATVGVKDLIIVVTDDIILVSRKDKDQKIKNLIKKIEEKKKFGYL